MSAYPLFTANVLRLTVVPCIVLNRVKAALSGLAILPMVNVLAFNGAANNGVVSADTLPEILVIVIALGLLLSIVIPLPAAMVFNRNAVPTEFTATT